MSNVAKAKRIEEPIKNSQIVTDGNVTKYDGLSGHASFEWPGALTVDLGSMNRIICIRFLLWDNLGTSGSKRDQRGYKYRLLTSTDHNTWTVVYDCSDYGRNGWQQFRFPDGLQMRYVRIHGLSNSANRWFHLVELEAHDSAPPELNAEIVLDKIISTRETDFEVGDGYPLETQMRAVVGEIEKLFAESKVLNPEPFNLLISQLKVQVRNVGVIDKGMEAIRKEIIDPVERKLKESNQIGVWSVRLGWIGGVLGLISIILSIASLLKGF